MEAVKAKRRASLIVALRWLYQLCEGARPTHLRLNMSHLISKVKSIQEFAVVAAK